MAKARGTDGSLLESLPWTLFALMFSLAPHILFLPWWITSGVCRLRDLAILYREAPPADSFHLVSWFHSLCCAFLGVLATYSTVSGVGPGSALLAIMAALKLLETLKRRDQFVLLFISIFLVMSSLLREQHLWSLPYLLVAVFLIMTAWLRISSAAGQKARRSFSTSGRLVMYAATAGSRDVDLLSAHRDTVLVRTNGYRHRHLWNQRHDESWRH